jgi:hypothetical protein
VPKNKKTVTKPSIIERAIKEVQDFEATLFVYICVRFWLLAPESRDLSQSETKNSCCYELSILTFVHSKWSGLKQIVILTRNSCHFANTDVDDLNYLVDIELRKCMSKLILPRPFFFLFIF